MKTGLWRIISTPKEKKAAGRIRAGDELQAPGNEDWTPIDMTKVSNGTFCKCCRYRRPLTRPTKEHNKLLELLQDGGSLPQVTIEASSVSDWQRILMDAHADLTRQLCYYMEDHNEQKVKRCLQQIETICQAWRTKGPTE